MPTTKRPASTLKQDLAALAGRAYHAREWSDQVLRYYHRVKTSLLGADRERLSKLHGWTLSPLTLWPFEMRDLLHAALAQAEAHQKLSEQQQLVIDLLPPPPDTATCEIVAQHELQVQTGAYENVVGSAAKYAQQEAALQADPEFQAQWSRIKAAFDLTPYVDHKGVIRRTMGTERNLRPTWSNRLPEPEASFQTAFDAFCLRWNLYGMLHDEPLLLKLAVNLTPFATMIVVPAYWSFDPKRDIRWGEIAKLHRARARERQGSALQEGKALRRKLALKLTKLDTEAARRGLRGEKKHSFLCDGLSWVPQTSAKRLSRLRAEFKK
jgi:hypothetical protein